MLTAVHIVGTAFVAAGVAKLAYLGRGGNDTPATTEGAVSRSNRVRLWQAGAILGAAVLLELLYFNIAPSPPLAPPASDGYNPPPQSLRDLGPPPLPIIEESIAVARFIVTGVDDVVEDAVKLACTALVFSSATAVTKRLRGGLAPAAPQPREGEGEGAGWQTQLQWNPVGFAAAIAAYPICDAAGDKLGDGAEIARDRVMIGFGLTPPARNTKPPGTTTAAAELQGYLAPILDDLIEDSFKGVCLGMHGVIGSALGTQLLQGSLGSWLPWLPLPAKTAAAAVLTYGTPLKQYTECNAWGDTFGDLAVAKLKVWGNSSSAPSTR